MHVEEAVRIENCVVNLCAYFGRWFCVLDG